MEKNFYGSFSILKDPSYPSIALIGATVKRVDLTNTSTAERVSLWCLNIHPYPVYADGL